MNDLLSVVTDHLSRIYPMQDFRAIARQALEVMELAPDAHPCRLHQNKWDQSDVWMITYGDSVIDPTLRLCKH